MVKFRYRQKCSEKTTIKTATANVIIFRKYLFRSKEVFFEHIFKRWKCET